MKRPNPRWAVATRERLSRAQNESGTAGLGTIGLHRDRTPGGAGSS